MALQTGLLTSAHLGILQIAFCRPVHRGALVPITQLWRHDQSTTLPATPGQLISGASAALKVGGNSGTCHALKGFSTVPDSGRIAMAAAVGGRSVQRIITSIQTTEVRAKMSWAPCRGHSFSGSCNNDLHDVQYRRWRILAWMCPQGVADTERGGNFQGAQVVVLYFLCTG